MVGQYLGPAFSFREWSYNLRNVVSTIVGPSGPAFSCRPNYWAEYNCDFSLGSCRKSATILYTEFLQTELLALLLGRYGGACFGVVVSASAVFPLLCTTPCKSWPHCDRNNAYFLSVVSVSLGGLRFFCLTFSRCFGPTKTVTSPNPLKMADSLLLRFSSLARCDSRSILSLDWPIPCANSCLWQEFQDANRFLKQAAALLPRQ